MAARHSRVRHVGRAGARSYLKKATEFFETMQQSAQARRWSAAGLNAVHCAISSCDAVLVFYTEQRSASSDRETAVHLLAALAKVPDARQKAETLRKILQVKNVVEYEDRAVQMHEALELTKLTERFYHWARGMVES